MNTRITNNYYVTKKLKTAQNVYRSADGQERIGPTPTHATSSQLPRTTPDALGDENMRDRELRRSLTTSRRLMTRQKCSTGEFWDFTPAATTTCAAQRRRHAQRSAAPRAGREGGGRRGVALLRMAALSVRSARIVTAVVDLVCLRFFSEKIFFGTLRRTVLRQSPLRYLDVFAH